MTSPKRKARAATVALAVAAFEGGTPTSPGALTAHTDKSSTALGALLWRLVKEGRWGKCKGLFYPAAHPRTGEACEVMILTTTEAAELRVRRARAAEEAPADPTPIGWRRRGYAYTTELAEAAGVHTRKIDRWCREGRIAALKIEGEWRIPAAAADSVVRRAGASLLPPPLPGAVVGA